MVIAPKKQNAILTFDYEVFLGSNTGTLLNSVINPTSAVLKILKDHKSKAIFFVDAAWLLFLEEHQPGDFMLVSDQLKEIIKSGSSVELHLHPQWINATVKGTDITFNTLENYKLHSLTPEKISELFSRSVSLLQGITGCKVRCFRAGGWCIDPFIKIKHAFIDSGIKYDFSVVPGVVLKEGKSYDYDFSGSPRMPHYRFMDDINTPHTNGTFVEFPLSTYKNNPIYRIINKVLLKLKSDSIYGDGTGSKERSFFRKLTQLLRFSDAALSLDRMSNLMFRFILWQNHRNSGLVILVSHPKILSDQALKNLISVVNEFETYNTEGLESIIYDPSNTKFNR